MSPDGRTSRRSSEEKLEHCKWEGCERPDSAHGLCRTHYTSARYSHEREHLIPERARAERCWVPECVRPAYAKGLCRAHYAFTKQHTIGTVERTLEERRRKRAETKKFVAVNPQRLTVLKTLSGTTLREMGAAMGYSAERARQLLDGSRGKLEKGAAQKLADYFGVSVEWLSDPECLGLNALNSNGEEVAL